MNFLSINDFSKDQILEIFRLTDEISKEEFGDLLKGRRLALLFEKPSTRTRVSFESAISMLGGNSTYLDAGTMQVSRGETYEDTAKVLSLYVNFIAARLHRQSDLERLANSSTVPVINALTDLEHPCQALSDIYTMRQKAGKLKGIKIAFLGDIATNTSNSLMLCATKLGMEVSLVGPKSIRPDEKLLRIAEKHGAVSINDDIKEGLKSADFVYTDTWVSMGKEAEAKRRKKLFAPYQLNRKAFLFAKKTALAMHCLPAHRGEEITAEVIDGKSSIVWEQAKNKMSVEAALLCYLSE